MEPTGNSSCHVPKDAVIPRAVYGDRTDLFTFQIHCHDAVAARGGNAVERVVPDWYDSYPFQGRCHAPVLASVEPRTSCSAFRIHCHDAVAVARGGNAVERIGRLIWYKLLPFQGRCRIPCCAGRHCEVLPLSASCCQPPFHTRCLRTIWMV